MHLTRSKSGQADKQNGGFTSTRLLACDWPAAWQQVLGGIEDYKYRYYKSLHTLLLTLFQYRLIYRLPWL